MSKKIWAICGGADWYDASVDYLILPDGMDIEVERKKRDHKMQEYHLGNKNGRETAWPGTFVEHLVSKGAVGPAEKQLEEYWED